MTILLALFYFIFPGFIIYLTQKSKFLKKVGAIVLAYAFGMLMGSTGILPRASETFRTILKNNPALPPAEAKRLFNEGLISASDLVANSFSSMQQNIINVVIVFAIPLLLFSLDFKKWLKLSREALFSLFLGLISLLIAIFIAYHFYKNLIDESWKVTGLLIGLYTGGTPNLAAIGTALQINTNTFILTHTYDMVIGAFFLLFLMTLAQRIFNLFLPNFTEKHATLIIDKEATIDENLDSFDYMLTKTGIINVLKAFGFSCIIVAVAGVLSILVPEDVEMLTVILSITTLGLLFSNWDVVNKIKHSFQLGMYFIIVFSLVMASMGDLNNMFHIEYIHLFFFVFIVVFGSMAVHVFLCYLFRVDSDTTIITITALTMSPPFVPVVAGAIKNKNIIISGLTVGILGYAIGNYLGLAIAYYLQ